MNTLKLIADTANERLNENVFAFIEEDNRIINHKNRCEGNDIDMTEEDGIFKLTMSGIKENYTSIEEAVQGLLDNYCWC